MLDTGCYTPTAVNVQSELQHEPLHGKTVLPELTTAITDCPHPSTRLRQEPTWQVLVPSGKNYCHMVALVTNAR